MVNNIEKYYDDAFVKTAVLDIARQMYADNFRPEYIVGLTRGGLVPGVMLSHYLDIPFHALNSGESNLWMAEDACGRKKILVIDDINDTGATIKTLKADWASSCPQTGLNHVFGHTVKFATLIENEASKETVDYAGTAINKAERPEWCVFPWESWW